MQSSNIKKVIKFCYLEKKKKKINKWRKNKNLSMCYNRRFITGGVAQKKATLTYVKEKVGIT